MKFKDPMLFQEMRELIYNIRILINQYLKWNFLLKKEKNKKLHKTLWII